MAISKNYTWSIKYVNQNVSKNKQLLTAIPNLKVELTNEVVIKDAYIAIIHLDGDKNRITYTFGIFTDSNKQTNVEYKMFEFIPDTSSENTPNFYVQAYNHLKSLPQFADAIDI